KVRSLSIDSRTSNGELYLPQLDAQTHQPKLGPDGQPLPPMKYEVRMGMIINPQTQEQFGQFIPPSEQPDGKLQGGMIVTGNPPQAIDLANFTKAVFKVKVSGQAGDQEREIDGVSLGGAKQADGSVDNSKSGLVN